MRTRLPGTPDPTHRWKVADDLYVTGDSWGDPSGPLVVLLHGGGQTRHAWGNTGAALGANGYRAVAFDARGHGDSDWDPKADYSMDAMVHDLVRLLHHLGDESPVLVGASMGGVTSLLAAGGGRVAAKAVILVDIVPQVEAAGVGRIRAFMERHPDGFESLDAVADAIREYRPEQRRTRAPEGLAKNVRAGRDGRYYWHWDPRFVERPFDLEERYTRLSAAARRLTMPTLLVRGGSSDVVSEEGVRHFQAICPGAEFADVAGAGHMVAGDRNDAFGRVAIQFLERVVPIRR